LRRERNPAAPPTDKESKPHSYGPTPVEKIPYVNQFFKQVGPAAASQDKEKMVEMLKAKAEAEAARHAQLSDELQDLRAKASEVAKRDEKKVNNAKLVVRLWALFLLTYPQRRQAVERLPTVEACFLNPP
jgi:hypothetical protein